jgi:hypothetical protein
MTWRITGLDTDGQKTSVTYDRMPDLCPLCRKSCTPEPIAAFVVHGFSGYNRVQIVFRCPNSKCRVVFFALYEIVSRGDDSYGCTYTALRLVQAQATEGRQWSQSIQAISPDFCEIYAQAEIAEANGLRMICGAGYRKSLEFLIKDFLIKQVLDGRPEDQQNVRESFLAGCINTYVDDARIKAAAEWAAWLGNDETHYVRKWEDKDLGDLKRLLEMTVHWIDLEMDFKSYEKTMAPQRPSKKGAN